MDAEDYKEARERKKMEFEDWIPEMRRVVREATENKGRLLIEPKCYLCPEKENLSWCSRKPGFWLCQKHRLTKQKPEIKIKDGIEIPF